MMLVVPVVSLVLAIIASASSFLIIDAEPGLVVVEPGSLVKLSCVVDDDYEYCMWHSPNNKMCDFEWKRHHNNITMQDCPLNENHEKISFHGKYDDRTCGISFIATTEDTGIWKCEVEEYVWGGSRNSGRKVFATMNVTVQARTTRSPSPSPTPPLTTTSTATTPTTTTTTTATTTVTTTKPTTVRSTTSILTTKTESVEQKSGDEKRIPPSAVPRVDDNSSVAAAGSGAGTAVAVVVVILLLAAVLAGAVFYRRRQRKRPDATAAVIYDREAKASQDTADMMKNSNNPELGIKEDQTSEQDNKHLHEFFPHSESFA